LEYSSQPNPNDVHLREALAAPGTDVLVRCGDLCRSSGAHAPRQPAAHEQLGSVDDD
jgi:hypothetical protein